MVTYVVPVPRARAAVAAGLNLVVLLCLLLVVAEPASPMGPGSVAIVAVGTAATAALGVSNPVGAAWPWCRAGRGGPGGRGEVRVRVEAA